MRNGTQTPRSMSNCSIALLDFTNSNDLLSAGVVVTPLTEASLAETEVENLSLLCDAVDNRNEDSLEVENTFLHLFVWRCLFVEKTSEFMQFGLIKSMVDKTERASDFGEKRKYQGPGRCNTEMRRIFENAVK